MKILFLSHYFPPEVNAPASRTFEHCRQWVKDGHEVTVVTCAPNHPRGRVYPGYRNRLFQREEKDGIRVVRLWTYVTANEGFVKRTLNYVTYMVAVILAIPFLPRGHVVVSTSPQFFNGLAGYFVSRLKRMKWVLEIRDLWPESILAVGAIKNRFLIGILESLEMFAYRKADRIVVVTDAFKVYIAAKGIDSDKIEVIKNGVDLDFYAAVDDRSDSAGIRRELGIEGKFVASYFGTHGMAHHLETILEAAELSRSRDDIVYLMVGDGAERERLLGIRNEKQLKNVIMLGQQPKDLMPAFWAVSDASLVLLKKSDLFKTVIPSKIFESMAMKRPLVMGVEGESLEMVQSANAGLAMRPESAEDLVHCVEQLADNPALRNELGANGRRYVGANYNRQDLARRFGALMAAI